MRIDPKPVANATDPRAYDFVGLTDMDLRRRVESERGIFMAEGHLIIERCADLGMEFRAVLTSERWLERLAVILSDTDVDVLVADEAVLRGITGYRVHRGALAVVHRPPEASVSEILADEGDILVLEDLVDPTNVGLAIRSAVVQGIRDVVLSPGCADPLYRKAVKASMGTVLRCRWARGSDWTVTLRDLSRARRLIALTPAGDRDLPGVLQEASAVPVALAFGTEGPGLTAEALGSAWHRCAIPMATDSDSLNVAAAVAVAAYARSRSIAT